MGDSYAVKRTWQGQEGMLVRRDRRTWDGETEEPAAFPAAVAVAQSSPKPFPGGPPETSVARVIDNFAAVVKEHTAVEMSDVAAILEKIQSVKATRPKDYDAAKLKAFFAQQSKTLRVLADGYFVARLAAAYPLVNDGIFRLKRHIYLQNNTIVGDATAQIGGGSVAQHLQVPLFVVAPSPASGVQIGNFDTAHRDGSRTTLTIEASVPGMPDEMVVHGRRALGFYHRALAEMLENPIVSDLVQHELMNPILHTMWIPSTRSLGVKVDKKIPEPEDDDPALLLGHGGKFYVVGLWDTVEELPFESILREFTSGTAAMPKRS